MAGRPLTYKNAEELEEAVKLYFDTTQIKTVTGLAYFLGFESRQSFYDYETRGEFSYTIKRARLFIEMGYEMQLWGTSNAGAIFALKNFGWKDKQEVEQTGGITIKYEKPGDYIYPSQDQSDPGIPESI